MNRTPLTPRDVDVTQPLPKEVFSALPKEAQTILIENEYPGDESSRLDSAMQEKSNTLRTKLAELQSAHTKKGELDEAAAIRDWVRANLKAGPGNLAPVEVGEPPRKDITRSVRAMNACRVFGPKTSLSVACGRVAH